MERLLKILSFSLVCVLFITASVEAQRRDEMMLRRAEKGKYGINPEEVVSFEQTFPYVNAIEELKNLCRKFAGKLLIDLSEPDTLMVIGIEVRALPWKNALELILRVNNRWYKEGPDYLQIFTLKQAEEAEKEKEKARERELEKERAAQLAAQQQAAQPPAEKPPTEKPPTAPPQVVQPTPVQPPAPVKRDTAESMANIREVMISAVFLAIDQERLKESGIGFKLMRGRGVNLNVEFTGATSVTSPLFEASVAPRGQNLAVDINAAIKFFENEAIGEVISRPQLIVRNGVEGMVQVGADFSVKERTIAGDVTDKFFHTGTILTATPHVYKFEDIYLISLMLDVEKSDVTPGAVSTIIKKTNAKTTLTLLNGEESFLGGLFSTEEGIVRQGIPFLKDLPWWFFGLRYLFGYDQIRQVKKDLIVLIKAELVPTPYDRSKMPPVDDVSKQQIEQGRRETEKHSQKATKK